jgi:NAD(P)H-dependent flavin oxidoreductase YrpB (nitropropane dioxygenase family)
VRTSLCERFGIDVPIFAFTHCRDVVVAVSRAGGLGVLGATSVAPDQLEIELARIEDELGDRPYGIDVVVPAYYVGKEEGGLTGAELRSQIPDGHRRFVTEILDRYGVPELPDPEATAPGRRLSLGQADQLELADIALRHRPKLIANALGPAPSELIDAAHERGIAVAALVGRKEQALRQKELGVDIIVAQGYEAGGHTGEIATMVLVPEVVDAVAPLPVLAAGGIARGRQVAAALALGAQGVWTGSVWLTTAEAETHPVVKEKFLAATSSDTVRSQARTGKPVRQLRSAWTEEWESAASPGPLPRPLHGMLVREALLRINHAAQANEGARQLINYPVGQVVGSLNQVKPAAQVLYEMVEELVETERDFARGLD